MEGNSLEKDNRENSNEDLTEKLSESIEDLNESKKENNISVPKDVGNIHTNESISSFKDIKPHRKQSDGNEDELSSMTSLKVKDQIDSICLCVFLNYSSFDLGEKDFFLSYQALNKLLLTAKILSKPIQKGKSPRLQSNQFNLILKKIVPKKAAKINSVQFFNLITLLTSREHKEEFNANPRLAILSFVQTYFNPIVSTIKQENSPFVYNSIEKRVNAMAEIPLDESTLLILKSQSKSLVTLYKVYFSSELALNKGSRQMSFLIKKSISDLIELCKNYSLSPSLLSIEKIAIIYNCIIDQSRAMTQFDGSNLGIVFTLHIFFKFLLYACDIIFLEESHLPHERLMMLFKRMETSGGFALTKKKAFGSNDNFTLEINHSLLKTIAMRHLTDEKANGNGEQASTIKSKDDIYKCTEEETVIANSKSHRNKPKDASSSSLEKETKYNELLEEFFETYATIGDKMNFSLMTITSFAKLIKDFGLFEIKKAECQQLRTSTSKASNESHKPSSPDYLTELEVNMIYFQVCRKTEGRNQSSLTNHPNTSTVVSSSLTQINPKSHRTISNKISLSQSSLKMTFDSFLKALHIIAIRLHPNLPEQEAMLLFKGQDLALDQSLQKPERGVTQLKELINYINNSDIKSILFYFQSSLYSLFLYYADANHLIDFHSFFLFYKDFSIFPDIANLVELKKMFFILLQIQTEGAKPLNTSRDGFKTAILAKYRSAKYDTLMTFDSFLYSLAIASRFVKGKDHSNEYEKLLHLLFKMTVSIGMNHNSRQLLNQSCFNIVHKDMIELMKVVKEKYSSNFPQENQVSLMLKSDNAYEKIFEDLG